MFLHVLSFDVPYPADYGGVIDVFYKLKALKNKGIKVYLHCFSYGRPTQKILLSLCEQVFYYPRKSPITSLPIRLPHIVQSRQHPTLLANLQKHDFPILFEGLHTCFYLNHPSLVNRIKMVRMHNIEWDYYYHLYQSEKNVLKKVFFRIESFLLKKYEKQLTHAAVIFAISPSDTQYLTKRFGRVEYLPAFHAQEQITCLLGKGDYALYHGNLGVSENQEAVTFLITKVFAKIRIPLIVAGKNASKPLRKLINQHAHISLVDYPADKKLLNLIQHAHVNILPTFQPTGIKLKLINALFNGRFCLVNPPMVQDTGLANFCHIATTADNFIKLLKKLFSIPFLESDYIFREKKIRENFYNMKNISYICKYIT